MADPIEDGRRPGTGEAGSEGCPRIGRDRSSGCGDVADGNSRGLEGVGKSESSGIRRPSGNIVDRRNGEGLALTSSERQQESGRIECGAFPTTAAPSWPAGRGAEQHDWEAPRVLRFERGVGSPIDGVPFRLVRRHNRDVLRGAGNAVVPQVVATIVARMKEIDNNA